MANKDAKTNAIEIIIETPRGCRNKYTYDSKKKGFKLKKILPAGAVFPYDFGFIPKTKGEDGDPLDILVIMDEPAYPGCIIDCRLVGVLKAKQTERDGKTYQNDRLIGVSIVSNTYHDIHHISDLNESVQKEIEHFFVSYNSEAGKKFQSEGWEDSKAARAIVKKMKY